MLSATAALFLVLACTLAPTALAAAEETGVTVPEPLRHAGDAVAAGATTVAAGAGAAAEGAGELAAAIGGGLLAGAKMLGGALAAGAKALGAFLAASANLAGALLAGAARLAGLALSALWTGLLATGAFLGMLLGEGVAFTRAHPVPVASAAGGAAATGGLLYLLKRLGGLGFLAPLYTRLAPGKMLENEARNSVYEFVKTNPGAHPSAIAEKLDLGWGTVVYHLAKLESSKLVTTRSAHNRKCYFALTAELDADARTAVAAMSTDKTRSIVEAVRASPGISQKELSERLGMSQALASWHVKRLVESGVLTTERAGRSNALRVAQHVPLAA